MKRISILATVFIAIFLLFSEAHAQDMEIIGLKGKVMARSREIAPWKKAEVGQAIFKDYEVMTKRRAECTISFGKGQKNTVTIKENSHVKIVDIISTTLELSKGRVFSLIEKMGKGEVFQVKTPAAITGARGTGLGVVFGGGIMSAFCFQGMIFVEGFDPQGNSTGEKDIEEGFKVDVDEDGEMSDLRPLSDEENRDWDEFKEDLGDLLGGGSSSEGGAGEDDQEIQEEQEEMREEQRDDLREDLLLEEREQETEDIREQEVEDIPDCWPYC